MDSNPYAPPVAPSAPPETSGALWNPGAAAAWSLIFTPVFGAMLHMRNWNALGDSARARAQWGWVGGALATFLLSIAGALVLPDPAGSLIARILNLGVLFAWYLLSAKQQINEVQRRFGQTYTKRSFIGPIGIAMAIGLLLFAFLFMLMFSFVSELPDQ